MPLQFKGAILVPEVDVYTLINFTNVIEICYVQSMEAVQVSAAVTSIRKVRF